MSQLDREILLNVLDSKFDDPRVLIETSREERAAASTYFRRYPLLWDPPPDTLFMRATKLDMGVFGEHVEGGELQMIESRHTSPGLEAALGRDAASTIAALVAISADAVNADEVSAALAGRWPDESTKRRGAVLQAAAFAHALLDAVRFSVPNAGAVVWEYTGRAPTYDYP